MALEIAQIKDKYHQWIMQISFSDIRSNHQLIHGITDTFARKKTTQLKQILNDKSSTLHDLSNYLQDVWTCDKKFYTAFPTHTFTKLMCELATDLSGHTKQDRLQLLMPTLHISYEDLRFDFMELIKRRINKNPDFSDTIKAKNYEKLFDLKTIVQQHIVIDNGRNLQSVLSTVLHLNKPEWEQKSLPRSYLSLTEPMQQLQSTEMNQREATSDYHLDNETRKKLYKHSSTIESLIEAREILDQTLNNDTTLLGQLNRLTNNLFYNSASGVGHETLCGVGATQAIQNFVKFYKRVNARDLRKLPEKLKQEIRKIRTLINDPRGSFRAGVHTCLNIRRSELYVAYKDHTKLLETVTLNSNQKKQLTKKTGVEFYTQFNRTVGYLLNGDYSGNDEYSITKTALDNYLSTNRILLELPIDLENIIRHLSPEDITTVLQNKIIQSKIWYLFNSRRKITLETIVYWVHTLPLEKLKALFTHIKPEIESMLYQSKNNAVCFIMQFHDEKLKFLLQNHKQTLQKQLFKPAALRTLHSKLRRYEDDQVLTILNEFKTFFSREYFFSPMIIFEFLTLSLEINTKNTLNAFVIKHFARRNDVAWKLLQKRQHNLSSYGHKCFVEWVIENMFPNKQTNLTTSDLKAFDRLPFGTSKLLITNHSFISNMRIKNIQQLKDFRSHGNQSKLLLCTLYSQQNSELHVAQMRQTMAPTRLITNATHFIIWLHSNDEAVLMNNITAAKFCIEKIKSKSHLKPISYLFSLCAFASDTVKQHFITELHHALKHFIKSFDDIRLIFTHCNPKRKESMLSLLFNEIMKYSNSLAINTMLELLPDELKAYYFHSIVTVKNQQHPGRELLQSFKNLNKSPTDNLQLFHRLEEHYFDYLGTLDDTVHFFQVMSYLQSQGGTGMRSRITGKGSLFYQVYNKRSIKHRLQQLIFQTTATHNGKLSKNTLCDLFYFIAYLPRPYFTELLHDNSLVITPDPEASAQHVLLLFKVSYNLVKTHYHSNKDPRIIDTKLIGYCRQFILKKLEKHLPDYINEPNWRQQLIEITRPYPLTYRLFIENTIIPHFEGTLTFDTLKSFFFACKKQDKTISILFKTYHCLLTSNTQTLATLNEFANIFANLKLFDVLVSYISKVLSQEPYIRSIKDVNGLLSIIQTITHTEATTFAPLLNLLTFNKHTPHRTNVKKLTETLLTLLQNNVHRLITQPSELFNLFEYFDQEQRHSLIQKSVEKCKLTPSLNHLYTAAKKICTAEYVNEFFSFTMFSLRKGVIIKSNNDIINFLQLIEAFNPFAHNSESTELISVFHTHLLRSPKVYNLHLIKLLNLLTHFNQNQKNELILEYITQRLPHVKRVIWNEDHAMNLFQITTHDEYLNAPQQFQHAIDCLIIKYFTPASTVSTEQIQSVFNQIREQSEAHFFEVFSPAIGNSITSLTKLYQLIAVLNPEKQLRFFTLFHKEGVLQKLITTDFNIRVRRHNSNALAAYAKFQTKTKNGLTDTLRDLFSVRIENYIQQRRAKQSNDKGYLSKLGHLFPHTSDLESKTHAAQQLQQALVNATNITHKDHNALAFGKLGTLFSQVLWAPPYVLHKSLDNVDKKTTAYVLLPNTTVVENSSTTSVTAAQT